MSNYGVIPQPEDLKQFSETAISHQVPVVGDILDLLVSRHLLSQVSKHNWGYSPYPDTFSIPYNREGFYHYDKYELICTLHIFSEEAIKLGTKNLVTKLQSLGYTVEKLYDEDGEIGLAITWEGQQNG
jgi:hypothetical protein